MRPHRFAPGPAIAGAFVAAAVAVLAAAPALPQNDRAGAIEHGRDVFDYWCAACHAAGPGMPGTAALQVKYDGALPALLTERSDLTAEVIAFYVRNGVSVMPPFRKTEIGDSDLSALASYIIDEASRR